MSTIFITGTSTGLGRAAVELFSAKGWRVIATMRTPEEETALGELPGVTLKQLDVTDPDAIVRVVADTLAEEPVDVLFNNAGYGLAGRSKRRPTSRSSRTSPRTCLASCGSPRNSSRTSVSASLA